MNEEQVKAAHALYDAATNYRKAYEKVEGARPIVYLKHEDTGEGVFIADSFNFELIFNRCVKECNHEPFGCHFEDNSGNKLTRCMKCNEVVDK